MVEEQVLFEEGNVRVTTARAVFGEQTYALSGVTGVRTATSPPGHGGPIAVVVIGAVLGLIAILGLVGSGGDNVLGGLFFVLVSAGIIALGIAWFRKKKPTYHIQLDTASGEASAYSSQDGNYVKSLTDALNNAIVERG